VVLTSEGGEMGRKINILNKNNIFLPSTNFEILSQIEGNAVNDFFAKHFRALTCDLFIYEHPQAFYVAVF